MAHNTSARRILTSLLAALVLIMALRGPVSWVCMLKSGGVQCCCVSLDVQEDEESLGRCCRTSSSSIEGLDVGPAPSGGEQPEDDEDPCGCGDDEPEPFSADPRDGGDASVVAILPALDPGLDWPMPSPRVVGAVHETQQRCTGPPLYVLFEVFLI